jgi:hypothetical protein
MLTSLLHYYSVGKYESYVIVDTSDPWMDAIYRHRGKQYAPQPSPGGGGFIADTRIHLEFPKNGDWAELRERSPWDTVETPRHKLHGTAHFLVTRHSGTADRQELILTGRIVPYSPERGLPMEDRWPEPAGCAYDWSTYMNGDDQFLRSQHLAGPLPNDLVEIGRVCGARPTEAKPHSPLPVLLGFKTLHRFLEERGVKNYACAAIDEPGSRYASLYEGAGLRKVSQYEVPTVTGIRERMGSWESVSHVLRYWALHMNVPHTQLRILGGDFGEPAIPFGAHLNKRILSFVTPYLFYSPDCSWCPVDDQSRPLLTS